MKRDTVKTDKSGKAAKSIARVLLVEDDPVLAMGLEDAFLRAGSKDVVICQTMKASMLELEKGARPDALVLDVHLGDRDDGWALAELVTMLGPKPPKIAFSTGSPEEIPEGIAKMGPVFEKPYDPDTLVEHLAMGDKRGIIARLLG